MDEARNTKRIVAEGYDRMGAFFDEWNADLPAEGRHWFLGETLARLPEGSTVIELGCGPGTDAGALSSRRRYVGLDLSPVQVSIARKRVPGAMFVVGDLTTVTFRPSVFDGVVAFYAFKPRSTWRAALRVGSQLRSTSTRRSPDARGPSHVRGR